jgi:hypothetical protein
MDILIWFKRKGSSPEQYLRDELDRMDVDWDDVGEGYPFTIEGNERVIAEIVSDARRDDNLDRVVYL